MPTLLEGIRVLDLANRRADLTGRVLADLGAEVLKIEPPGGTDSRRVPPFESDDESKSLYWAHVGQGKLSVVLDLRGNDADRAQLQELAKVADVLIESDEPGAMAALGLGHAELMALNPRLIYVSVTPWGQEGPKAHWAASDLTLQSAGGRTALQGDTDRQPLPVGYPHQASFQSGVQAAADVVIALNEREESGLGQYLDTSMAECMVWSLLFIHGWPTHTGSDPVGVGDDRGSVPYTGINPGFECADGRVLALLNPIQMGNIATTRLIPALEREGLLPEVLKAIDWEEFAEQVRDAKAPEETIANLQREVTALIKTRTKRQWIDFASRNGIYWAPINTTKDMVESDQLAFREYWTQVGDYTVPGPIAKLSRTPIVLSKPAPKLGADQGKLRAWTSSPPERKLPAPVSAADRLGEAFKGIKIADFTWIATGPVTTKAMADHGATVVKIESEVRPDSTRLSGPFRDSVSGLNRSFHFSNWNTSKLDVTINIAKPEGKALARRVIDWADVVVDNYSAGTMDRLGFGYDVLSKDHPELIMLSSCLLGQTGPWRDFSGGGNHGAALAGFHAITGWPDRAPTGPAGAYSDLFSARFSEAVLAAAILERRRSGKGQYIDMSQVEAVMYGLGPLLLDETVNGRTAQPAGLRSDLACPNGTYPVEGTQRYIAISVETPQQWQTLRSMVPGLAEFSDPKYDDLSARREVSDAMDERIAAWTAGFDRFELEKLLGNAGVPVSVVARPSDMQLDEQFKSRGFFLTIDHPEMGPSHYDAFATRFSAKREMLHRYAPCLGEDTAFVMTELLRLSEDEIAELAAQGVLT